MTKVILTAACLFAFIAPFVLSRTETGKSSVHQNGTFRGFPGHFEGAELRELALTEREEFFLRDFPGKIGRFTDGRREIIIRYVTEATRKLHSPENCFRAAGYETTLCPMKIDETGKRWSCFSAARNDERLHVCERIYDENGNQWTDVSAWYWSAISQTNGGGEWWALTVAERE